MVANIRGYTPNYGFKLINFDTPRWHTHEYANWSQLDSMFLQLGTPPVRGEWLNSTLYVIGDRVFDGQTGDLYRCLVQHTSTALGTFEEDRIANPTYWTLQILGVPLFRAAWTPATVYALGDIVTIDEFAYYLCTTAHTSSATFPPDASFWQTIFDATNIVLSVEAAADSAAAAATSASEAAASAAAAEQAASAATSAQSAFRWSFDSDTAIADPGVGMSRMNSAVPTSITKLILSANSADFGNPDVSGWVITWDDSTNLTSRGSIYVRKADAPENYLVLEVNGPVLDHGTWQEVSVNYIAHGGTLADNEVVAIAFTRTGNSGTSGAGSGDVVAANNMSEYTPTQDAARGNIGIGPTDTPTFVQVHVGPPTVDDHAATKLYTDSADAALTADYDAGDAAVTAAFQSADTAIISDYQAADATLQTNINAKADTTYVNSQNAAQDTTIAAKADTTYVNSQDALKAPLASPTFTGDPKAPDQAVGDNDQTIANTKFVHAVVDAAVAPATSAEYLSNAAVAKMLTPNAVWGAAAVLALGNITVSVAPNLSLGIDFAMTLNAPNIAFNAPTNAKIGQKGIFYISQDATGGRLITWDTVYKFPGGTKPTLSTGAAAFDAVAYSVVSASQIICTFQGAFA